MNMIQTSRRRAFTLIELMVVIGIIVLLISLLLPAVAFIRRSGHITAATAQIRSLEAAINVYYAAYRAYPGIFPDEALGPSPLSNATSGASIVGRVTGTENLFLSLCGGINAMGKYDASLIGTGPFKADPVNPASLKQIKPFYDNWAAEIVNSRDTTYSKDYRFREASLSPPADWAGDSNVPEFMDRFPDSLPLLYLRAKVGATGVSDFNSPSFNYQYSTHQASGYTAARGRKLGLAGNPGSIPQHGLGTTQNADGADRTLTLYAYLSQNPNNAVPANLSTGVCRARDTFVIISAGPDRIYGTKDDITSFGNVMP